MTPQEIKHHKIQRKRGLALLGAIAALFMLTPPVLTIANNSSAFVWQIPSLFVYLFGVWAALIILSIFLTKLSEKKEAR